MINEVEQELRDVDAMIIMMINVVRDFMDTKALEDEINRLQAEKARLQQ